MKELISNLEVLNRKAEKAAETLALKTTFCGQADRP